MITNSFTFEADDILAEMPAAGHIGRAAARRGDVITLMMIVQYGVATPGSDMRRD